MNISNAGREGDKKMEKLEKCDYGKVAGLFEGTNHGIPLIYSVLEGKGTGNIYVDSVSEPKNALILPQGGFFYLASKDHNRNFLLQVKELVFQELIPVWSCGHSAQNPRRWPESWDLKKKGQRMLTSGLRICNFILLVISNIK